MTLYLLRHGIAEAHAPTGRDPDRRLTPAGAAELRLTMKRAAAMGIRPELIFASPYRRAMETAAIASSVLGFEGDIVTTPALTPDSGPADAWTDVRAFPEASSVLLVAHEPLLSATLAWLLGVSRAGPGFSTSGLACVELERTEPAPFGKLKYMLSPASLSYG